MGAQWKHSIRQGNNAKKGAIMSKLVKEIIVSSKMGGPDPSGNFRLRTALEEARKNSVPRDTIERAIKRGAGLLDEPVVYETIIYEGFAPHQVPILVECLTENRNRTAADIRVIFRKGQLGNSGSVAWMFEKKGQIEAHHSSTEIDPESAALEAGADDVESIEGVEAQAKAGMHCRFFCSATDLDSVTKSLASQGWNIDSSELTYLVKEPVSVPEAAMKDVVDFLETLDDHDDVHRLYTALKS
jgi:YebC/PmpR family DNA-binding regulatory protein